MFLSLIHISSDKADAKMRIFNADGSEAKMCGNGIRCVGKFLYDKGIVNKTEITVDTLSGIKTLKLNITDNKVDTVCVDMGKAILEPKPVSYTHLDVYKRQGMLMHYDNRDSHNCKGN